MLTDKSEPLSAFAVYSAMKKKKQNELSIKTKNIKKQAFITNNFSEDNHGQTEKRIKKAASKNGFRFSMTNQNFNNIKCKALSHKNLVQKLSIINSKKGQISEVPGTALHSKCNKQLKHKKISILKKKQKMSKIDKRIEQLVKDKLKKNRQNLNNNPDLVSNDVTFDNPIAEGRRVFNWLIYPIKAEQFFRKNWENTPIHIKRKNSNCYKLLISTPLIDQMLRENYILFTKNIDITSYTNGVRETHNPPGRALPSIVWDYYLNGCSVRMLNPQTFMPKLYTLNATLQEYFGCFVGANFYLTPPNSQGFAPHYDDIEAFILQIEGKKRWRLYKPKRANDNLPRFSSKNFDESEIGEPILDTIVNAGDLLYFPRGTIHQGETIDNTHSLHITLSVYQRNSWGDYISHLLPKLLESAFDNKVAYRKGLPLDYLNYIGFAHSSNQSDERKSFVKDIKKLFIELLPLVDKCVDEAADIMAKQHLHDFLPPALNPEERECSVVEDGETMSANGIVNNCVEIEPDTRIRLLRSHCARLVEEAGTYKLYYSTENTKEYHEYEPQFLEVEKEFVPAIKEIITHYPEYISVEDLPIEGEDNKIQIAKDLWEKCIVVTKNPLSIISD
ncbi:ribosomal oxygenase 1 [Prorops nasuta]|uniref:ribosomal oxygenase 1 n=1 Tax=Prorops nasuta TaxID=863751 RepID=UPI0034CFF005